MHIVKWGLLLLCLTLPELTFWGTDVIEYFTPDSDEQVPGEGAFYFNWTYLFYNGSYSKPFKADSSANFISEQIFEQNDLKVLFNTLMFKGLYQIRVNSSMTLFDLISMNSFFFSKTTSEIYKRNLIHYFYHINRKMNITGKVNFLGESGLIDLIYQMDFFPKSAPLKKVKSSFIANRFDTFVFEARGLGIKPVLFPTFYSYDKNKNLIKILDFTQGSQKDITANGFVQYQKNRNFIKTMNNKKIFNASVISTKGQYTGDIIIPREEYLKIFSSEFNIMQIKTGNIIIITDS